MPCTSVNQVSHKDQGMEAAALNLLEELKLDLKICRGQSYDNASNMSGVYSGPQSRIREKNVRNMCSSFIKLRWLFFC
ncbi:hypothetical protein TNCT_609601 [Trichonephila clavata]|uniref:DUF4371 domain-containing protein n=1 Tax=Trichonephila clavata TaxID=2740835 RepID=A0A8X6FH07_TRICU|nr:hypothetical protein TNCT_609601 [Trichonephila clavata]